MSQFDVAIVGAGIAGASLAAEIGDRLSVVLLEAEDRPGYHATGRSAAFWHETYGGPLVQPLTRASVAWLSSPPPETGAETFLTPRGAVTLARAGDGAKLERFAAAFADNGLNFAWLDRAALLARCPGLRPEWSEGLYEPDCADIDVAGAHQAFLKLAARTGTVLQCRAPLVSATRQGTRWTMETGAGALTATTIVNAAGAWADEIATRCGARPVGIEPFRRTIVQLRLDRDIPRDLPLTIDVDGQFYFKPDGAGGLWLSPHDETPSPAIDVAPEELDVAVAIDRMEQVVEWGVRAVTHKWAGLRSFSPDRLPVYGFAPETPGFFWCAGQGGFGIQTAPAAARLAAAMLTGDDPGAGMERVDPALYAPARFT